MKLLNPINLLTTGLAAGAVIPHGDGSPKGGAPAASPHLLTRRPGVTSPVQRRNLTASRLPANGSSNAADPGALDTPADCAPLPTRVKDGAIAGGAGLVAAVPAAVLGYLAGRAGDRRGDFNLDVQGALAGAGLGFGLTTYMMLTRVVPDALKPTCDDNGDAREKP